MNLNYVIDGTLLSKYPPVISAGGLYPIAKNLKRDFFKEEMVKAVRSSINEDLCIVVKFPAISKNGANIKDAIDYLDHLILEIVSKSDLFQHYKITELHLQGELCSLLPVNQLVRLNNTLSEYFDLQTQCKKVIEVMPDKLDERSLNLLHNAGFSNIEFLLRADNLNTLTREQFINTFRVSAAAFEYVNANLLFTHTLKEPESSLHSLLENITKLKPDQINLTHDFSSLSTQSCLSKLTAGCRQRLVESTRILTALNYHMLAPGHFVTPDSMFAHAQKQKQLHLNVTGFSLQEYSDVLGIGAGAVSEIANMISQNVVEIELYSEMLGNFGDAIEFGCVMSENELLRRHIVKELLCNLYLDKTLINQTFDIHFDHYFAPEMASLDCLIKDGLVLNTDFCLSITPKAKLFIQNVCDVFTP